MALILAILIAGLIFWIQWRYFRRHWQHGLDAQITFCQRGANAGEHCQLKEIIYNAKRMPLPALQLKLQTSASFRFDDSENADVSDFYYRTDFYAVGGYQKVTRTLDFVPTQRGYYQIKALDLLTKDFFHTSRYSSRRENETGLYVYPYKRDTKDFDVLYRQIMGDLIARKQMEEDLFAFRGIREYRPTDSMRRINWKASAQNHKLLVNMYESTFSRKIYILLDGHTRSVVFERYMQESGISVASSVADMLISSGIPVALQTNMKDVLTEEPVMVGEGLGRYHMELIDRSLAGIDLEKEMTSYTDLLKEACEQADGQTCFLLITSGYSDELFQALAKVREQGTDCYGIVPWRGDEDREAKLPAGMTYWEV